MKKEIILLMAGVLYTSFLFAKTITVSNNPNSPGQFTRLDSAIADASAGDILLVSGSATGYGNITINKPLTLFGHGYDPRNDQAISSSLGSVHIVATGSGTTISGFALNQIWEDGGTNNITVTRCHIGNMWNSDSYTNGINGNNYFIRDNIIGNIAITAYNNGSFPVNGIIIQNNIIAGAIGCPAVATDIIVSNNYFTGGTPLGSFAYGGSLHNANVYNNIFYYKNNGSISAGSATANCIFTNNIFYNYTNATESNFFALGTNNNSGSGNINANPAFVSVDLSSVLITRKDNFNLQAGSPGKGTGTDGKDIGPEGGDTPIQYPYTGYPAIPVIDSMRVVNPIIPPNGTLKINFKAHSNN